MANTDILEQWLADHDIPLEKYTTVLQSGPQMIMGQTSMVDFQKAVLDWQATYSNEVVSKTTAGVNKFSYMILGNSKGYMVTIDNTAAAPGVVVKMNPIEEYFSQHRTQLRLFKYGTVALVPIFSVLAIGYLQTTEWTIKAALITAITGLNLYVANLKPEAYWDGVGFQVKRKR